MRAAVLDPRLDDALAAVVRALDACRAPWMITGGVAAIAHGVVRPTSNIDCVLRADALAPDKILRALGRQKIEARGEGGDARAELEFVVLARHEPTGVDVDISLAWSGLEHDAITACQRVRLGRSRAPVVTAGDLVVFKAILGRPRDLEDIEALLLLHPDIDVIWARDSVSTLAELAEDRALFTRFDQALSRVSAARRARRH